MDRSGKPWIYSHSSICQCQFDMDDRRTRTIVPRILPSGWLYRYPVNASRQQGLPSHVGIFMMSPEQTHCIPYCLPLMSADRCSTRGSPATSILSTTIIMEENSQRQQQVKRNNRSRVTTVNGTYSKIYLFPANWRSREEIAVLVSYDCFFPS